MKRLNRPKSRSLGSKTLQTALLAVALCPLGLNAQNEGMEFHRIDPDREYLRSGFNRLSMHVSDNGIVAGTMGSELFRSSTGAFRWKPNATIDGASLEFIEPVGPLNYTRIAALNADGTVLVGNQITEDVWGRVISSDGVLWIENLDGTMEEPGPFRNNDGLPYNIGGIRQVNADGSKVLGYHEVDGVDLAFTWNRSGDSDRGEVYYHPTIKTGRNEVIDGFSSDTTSFIGRHLGSIYAHEEPLVGKLGGEAFYLENPIVDGGKLLALPQGASSDGSEVIVLFQSTGFHFDYVQLGFLWSECAGYSQLFGRDGFEVVLPSDISGNARIIIGSTWDEDGDQDYASETGFWNGRNSFNSFDDYLAAVIPDGWADIRILAISDDASKLAGIGTNPDGLKEAFMISGFDPPVFSFYAPQVTVTNEIAATHYLCDPLAIEVSASDCDGTIEAISVDIREVATGAFIASETKTTSGNGVSASFEFTFDSAGFYELVMSAHDSLGDIGYETITIEVEAAEINQSFSETLFSLPGKIEMEYFINDGNGLSYFDTTCARLGNSSLDVGPTSVDIGYVSSIDTTALYYVGAGEYLTYKIEVPADKAGDYQLRVNLAAAVVTDNTMQLGISDSLYGSYTEIPGSDYTFRVGPLVRDREAWQIYEELEGPIISLEAGVQYLRVYLATGNFNFDYMELDHLGPSEVFPQIPSDLVQAEAHDEGEQGETFFDLTDDAVDTRLVRDETNGIALFPSPGEWTRYTVNVSSTGPYKLRAKVASQQNSDKLIHLSSSSDPSVPVIGSILFNTEGAGAQDWINVESDRAFSFDSTGIQQIYLHFKSGGFRLDHVEFVAQDETIPQLVLFEAEHATLEGAIFRTDGPEGMTGGSYVRDDRNAADDFKINWEFDLAIDSPREVDFSFRVKSRGTRAQVMQGTISGGSLTEDITFTISEISVNQWTEYTVSGYSFGAGTYTVVLQETDSSGALDVDALTINLK